MIYALNRLLSEYPKYEKLAAEAEELRVTVDSLQHDSAADALDLMLKVDTKMLELLSYHIQLSSACLKGCGLR